MGKRGPAPAPTSLKIIRGDQQHRINRNEPQPAGEIVPPSSLTPAERKIWNRLAPELTRQRVLKSNDVASLAVYCRAEAQSDLAMADVNARGASLVETRGSAAGQYEISVVNPSWRIVMDAWNQMLKYGARFGLTPSDRQALTVEAEPDDASPAAAYLT